MIPLIFAFSIMVLPGTFAQFFANPSDSGFFSQSALFIATTFSPTSVWYWIVIFILVVVFTFFYTLIIFQQQQLAENLQKNGGFVPGIRPGKRTSEYIERVLTRLTFVGAIYLSFVVILPTYLIRFLNVPFFFGGTVIGALLSGWDQPVPLSSAWVYGASLIGAGLGCVIAVGALPLVGGIGVIAVAFAMINVVGGYVVTDRMLQMFKRKPEAER